MKITEIIKSFFEEITEKGNKPSNNSFGKTISTSYWESFKTNNPNKAKDIEELLELNCSELSDRDIKEKIQMIERLCMNKSCSIKQLKKIYIDEIKKYPNHMIPKMLESTKKQILEECSTYHILEGNTASALMIKWLEEWQNTETYWDTWQKQHPEEAKALTDLTNKDFNQMDEIHVKQTIKTFSKMAEKNGFSDWRQIKESCLDLCKNMMKDISEEEILNIVLVQFTEQESKEMQIYNFNTIAHYTQHWFKDYIKSIESATLAPMELFRKNYRDELTEEIGYNANNSFFCEGYNSPVANALMKIMYRHLKDDSLKKDAEKQDLWNQYVKLIVEETEKMTDKYCHASLQECIEYYNFPNKRVVTTDRCPLCRSKDINVQYDPIVECFCLNCGNIWHAPFGRKLYL